MSKKNPSIPGFFFDTEKKKYFPIQMKAAYDAEQKRKSEELEQKLSNINVNGKVEISVDDLVSVWSSIPVEFDSVLQRIERMRVCEISWPEKIKIDADKGIYYRYFYEQGFYTVQHVIPSQNECERVIKEFKHMCPDLVIDFGVVPVKDDDEFNRDFLYWFVKGERVCRVSDNDSEFEDNLDIFIPNTSNTRSNNSNNAAAVTSHSIIRTGVIEDSHGFNVIISSTNDYLILRGEIEGRQGFFTRFFDGKYHEDFNVSKQLDFICRVPELGLAHISFGGLIQINHPSVPKTGIKLKSSSATWLHYHSNNLYTLTYHGDLVRFNLRQAAAQMELFNVKDLSQLPWTRFKFQDLLIEATKAVLLIGFRGGKEILLINLNNPTNVVKKITLKSKIESFKLSSDYTNLYVHNLNK